MVVAAVLVLSAMASTNWAGATGTSGTGTATPPATPPAAGPAVTTGGGGQNGGGASVTTTIIDTKTGIVTTVVTGGGGQGGGNGGSSAGIDPCTYKAVPATQTALWKGMDPKKGQLSAQGCPLNPDGSGGNALMG